MIRISTLLLATVMAAGAAQAQPQAPVTVRTSSGPVAGVVEGQARVFRNIPFAAAPVGALRWAPPQPVKAWTAPRVAALAGPSCPQPMTTTTPSRAKFWPS